MPGGDGGLKATEIGDAVHRLLELVDLVGAGAARRSSSCATWYPAVTDEELERIAAFVDAYCELGARGAHRDARGRAARAAVRVRARRRAAARPPRRALARRRRARSSLDYKTNSLAEGTPEEIVEADYRLQRLVYALACFRAGAEEVEVVYHFLERPDAVVSTTFERRELPVLEAELSAAIARINAGEFVPTPSEFTCVGCPALDLVCAGPRLGGGAWPPQRPSRVAGLMARSYVARGAAKRVGAEEATRIRPVDRAARGRARRREDRADVREPARAARLGDALGADDRRERQPRHREAVRRSTAGPRTTSRCRARSSSATSSRPASTARRRSRCAGR